MLKFGWNKTLYLRINPLNAITGFSETLCTIKMKTMRQIIFILTIILITSCATEKKETNVFKVGYNGALKNIMHKGDLSAQADLSQFQNAKHIYALGAIENLKGEILVLDSQPYISSAQNQKVMMSSSLDQKATLLVYTSVESWRSYDIPDEIKTYENLELYIAQVAKNNQINMDKPFPFLITGKAESIEWHVIDWKDGDMEHTHEKHIMSGPHGTLQNPNVEILGFYSNSHHAIFTHHTTNMHLHFKTEDNSIAGHLDGILLGTEMTLKLPDLQPKN